MDNILLSKIVANPTDTTWSQAYSTLNFYLVLSIKAETSDTEIAASGKELFEQIQREYFALDQKDLNSIKKSVENALEKVVVRGEVSVVLGTVKDDILYLVISNEGEVILKRDDSIGAVAKGEVSKITGFSGKLTDNDIIIIETGDFAKKIPLSELSKKLDHLSVTEISEALAPQIHEEAQGTEASIILQYKSLSKTVPAAVGVLEDAGGDTAENHTAGKIDENSEYNDTLNLDDENQNKDEGNKKSFLAMVIGNIPNFKDLSKNFGRKKIIVVAILLLIIVLVFSILYQSTRQEQLKREALYVELIGPIQKDYDEAIALESLNKGLALSEFESVKTRLDDARSKFKENSTQIKKVDELIGMTEKKIGELGSGSTVDNEKIIFDASKNDIKRVDLLSFKGGNLLALNKNTGDMVILSSSGDIESELSSEVKNAKSISSDKSFVYVLGDTITRIDKNNKKSTEIIEKVPSQTIAVDTFLGNVYTLSTTNDYVNKYASSGFSQSKYFTTSETFSANPTSFSIDGSIWIIDNDGQIREFNKGSEKTFTINGLAKKAGANSQIYTDQDYSDIYVLDSSNSRIISISKDGTYKNQYVWKVLSSASSFSVDEDSKKAFVIVDNKIHSFDL